MDALKQIRTAFVLLIACILVTGVVYPAFITGIAALCFPWQANGSLLEHNGKIVGSRLIGQFFDSPSYFWGRPSATSPYPYNGMQSSGSNMGPTNPAFLATVQERVNRLKESNSDAMLPLPIDLLTASASGLDAEISPLAARYQVARIAKARHISKERIDALISKLTKERTFFILGEPRIAVLELNLALDEMGKKDDRTTTT